MFSLKIAHSTSQVSALGFGCMGMSEFYGPRDDASALSVLSQAAAFGINFFDSADMYGSGHNEELLGIFAKSAPVKPIIATKFGIVRAQNGTYKRRIDNSPTYIRQACEASLRRLKIDSIDLYYIHRIERGRPIEDTVSTLADLQKEGKIKSLGICEPSADTLRRAHAVTPISAVQSEYSLWSRDPEFDHVLDVCNELDVTFVAYSPLGRGFLTGNIAQIEQLDAADMRRSLPRFQAGNFSDNMMQIRAIHAVADQSHCSPAQVCLAWLRRKQPRLVAIPGMRRLAHLVDNVQSLKVELSDDQMTTLNAAFEFGAAKGARYSAEGLKGVGV